MLDFGYYNMDCIEGMKKFPDNYFELAIADPPYGSGGGTEFEHGKRFGGRFDRYKSGGGGTGKQRMSGSRMELGVMQIGDREKLPKKR